MRTLCLTVPEAPHKTEAARLHFAHHGLEVTFVPGIHGSVSGIVTRHTYELDHPETNYRMTPDRVAIWLGHYMMWVAVLAGDAEYVLLLEDDAKLPDKFQDRQLEAICDTPQGFDMLYLGSCCCKDRPSKHVQGHIYEVKYPLCLHAYIISKKAAGELVESQRDCFAPIDISLTLGVLKDLKVYTYLPRLVDQFNTPLE